MVRALALRARRAGARSRPSALAHATLQATMPERGAKLDTPPAEVEFRFDESVEASFGALRVFDSKGQEVQTGKAFHPDGKGAQIAVKLKPGLGDGTYTATYRVVSADGHAVSSGFVFTVGEAAAPAESLDQLLAGGGTGPVTNTALGVARGFQYARDRARPRRADLLPRLWRRARRRRARSPPGSSGSCSSRRSSASSRPSPRSCCRAPSARAATFWAAARPDTVREVLGTRFGRAWGLGALAWLLVGAALALRPLRRGATAPSEPARPRPALAPAAAAAALAAPSRRRRRVRTASPPRARRARRPALRARAAALVRRPHERAVAGGDPAAREHPPRARDERVARRDRGARVRAALRHRGARARRSGRRCWPASSGASRRSPSIALPVLLLSGVLQAIVEVRSFPRAARQRVRARGADQGRDRARDRRARLHQPPGARARAAQGGDGQHVARPHRRAAAADAAASSSRSASPRSPPPARSRATRRRSPSPAGPYATTVNVGPARARGHGRPREGRPEPAAPVPVRPQDRRGVRARPRSCA